MKRLRSGGPAPVAGFAARACARALRVDLATTTAVALPTACGLKGNDGRPLL